MRQLFFKLLPFVSGGLLGWLVFFPPDDFLAIGSWRPLLLGLVLVVGTVVMTALQFPLTLPRDPVVEPAASREPPAEVASLIACFTLMGFDQVDSPLRVELRPTAFLWPFFNHQLGCVASVYCTTTIPAKVGFDLVSVVEGDRGWLTSCANAHGFVLPAAPGSFRQVLPGAAPDVLLHFHMAAHNFLASRGVRFANPPPGTPAERLRRGLVRQREAVMAKPLRAAAVALWRTITKRTPFGAPIAQQRSTESTLAYVVSEGR